MGNLLEETRRKLSIIGKSPSDVRYVGSKCGTYSCTWVEFENLADRDYDSGYGCHEVALDLIIIFEDSSRLERWEYDGSEGWEYVPVIDPYDIKYNITNIFEDNSKWSLDLDLYQY